MKKKSSSGSGGGIQTLVANHIEKAVFGLCVVLFVMFIYMGFSLKAYKKVPQDIRDLAQRAQQNVERDSWENVKDEPERVTLTNYSEAVKEGNVATPGALYVYNQPLNPIIPRPLVKRTDPELYPPVKLVVRAMNAPIAYRNTNGLPDRLAELKTAVVEAPKTKPDKDKDRDRRRRGAMPGGVPGDFMPPGMEEGMDGESPFSAPPGLSPFSGSGGSGLSPSGGPKIFRHPEGWRPGGSFGGMMDGGMPGMSSGPAGLGGPKGPGASGAGPMGPGVGSTTSPSNLIAKPAHIVCVLALVPFEKQADEFKHKLEGAVGYEPTRDRPNFVAFAIERAEVPEDPNAELQWVKIGSTNDALKEAAQWGGQFEEVANPLYTLPYTTMPIPPILLRNIPEFVDHPDIPRKHQQVSQTPDSTLPAEKKPTDSGGDVPSSDVPSGNFRAGVGYGSPMGPGGLAAGPGGLDGADAPPDDMSGFDGGPMAPGMGPAGLGMGPPGMSGKPGMGSMGMMGGGGSFSNAQPVTEYKLLRYFDLTALPGKQYRYRVQLLVEDPNHPQRPEYDVSTRMLSDEVAKRVADLQAKEPKNGPRRFFFRRSDWSEPSDVIALPPPERFYVGPAVKSAPVTHKNGAQLQRDWLVASVAGVFWDESLAADVSVPKDVFAGGALNQHGDTEVVHPLTLEFKIVEKYDFRTDVVVADMRGGEVVGGERTSPLYAPNEAVFVDRHGNLIVRNEIDDLDLYRRYAFVEDEPQPSMTGGIPGMPGMEPGGDGFDMMPGMMPEGMGGKGRGRRSSGRGAPPGS